MGTGDVLKIPGQSVRIGFRVYLGSTPRGAVRFTKMRLLNLPESLPSLLPEDLPEAATFPVTTNILYARKRPKYSDVPGS